MKICTAILALTSTSVFCAQAVFAQGASMPRMQSLTPPASGPAAPVDPNKVIITIGAQKITAGQYEALVDSLPPQYQTYARGAGKRQFAEQMVQLNLLSHEAEKLGLDKQPKMQEQLAFQRQSALAQAMFENIQQNAKVDDATVQAYYDAHKNENEAVKARHILIRVKGAPMPAAEGKKELTDEEALAKAQDIRKKLVAGGDFAALAKTESDDSGSGAMGGDLGEFHRGMMVPPFETAAFSLKPGEISEPIKTPFGYHIIQVQEHKQKTLAEVRPELEKTLRPEIAKKEVESMRVKSGAIIDDSYFGPAAPPPTMPGPAK